MTARHRQTLSPLEHRVMQIIWSRGPSTAEDVQEALGRARLTNASVRTLLRRMERKGYVLHRLDGRKFVYDERIGRGRAASGAVRGIIERFCNGSVEQLLVGLVDNKVIDAADLRTLAKRVRDRQKREAND